MNGESASGYVLTAFLLFCRIGGCLMLMPGFSNSVIPMQIRLYVAMAVTFILYPLLYEHVAAVDFEGGAANVPRLILFEVLIGIWLGFLARLFLLAFETFSVMMSMALNLSNPSGVSFDQGEPVPPLGTILGIAFAVMIFAMDIHIEIIRALMESYQTFPVRDVFSSDFHLRTIADQLTNSFLIALRVSSPVIIYSILVNFAIGIINKFTAQIQVYFIFMPFVIFGGLVIVFFISREMLIQLMAEFSNWLKNG